MDTQSSLDIPKTGPVSAGSWSVSVLEINGLEDDELGGVATLEVKGDAGAAPLVIDAVFIAVDLGITPCVSIASRAAFSLALLALSNTSFCI